MFRIAGALTLGFILIFVESMIVMQLKGYQTIQFDNLPLFASVWAMNFFLVFSILTQVKMWVQDREEDGVVQFEKE